MVLRINHPSTCFHREKKYLPYKSIKSCSFTSSQLRIRVKIDRIRTQNSDENMTIIQPNKTQRPVLIKVF